MSDQITTAHVQAYRAGIMMLAQQKFSILRGTVVEDTIVGKQKFVDQVGTVEMVKRTSRHSDTPLIDTPHARRMVTTDYFEIADLIDDFDKVRTLNDPTNSYVQAHGFAAGRKMDQVIRDAATGDAKTGETGSTTQALGDHPTAGSNQQLIAVDFVESGGAANSGLTVGKLRQANFRLRANNVIGEKYYLACTAKQVQDLLRDDEVTSIDFNTVRALVSGEVTGFMGFEFRITEELTLNSSTDVRTCFAYSESALLLAVGRSPFAKIDMRPDKSYSTQAYFALDIGATRLEEAKVVQILADESP